MTLRKPFFSDYAFGKGQYLGKDIYLVKPLTFMNDSGRIIGPVLRKSGTGPDNLVVVCDNLDLPPGICRIKKTGSNAGHNGLKSIITNVGTGDFIRIYLGAGHPGDKSRVIEHVLGDPGSEEMELHKEAVKKGADAVLNLLSEDIGRVMNAVNRKNPD